jgi:hypothetical protein
MPAYRTEVTVSENGTLLINDLPFQPGEKVEVLVRSRKREPDAANPYPLRGTPVQYRQPFDSVAADAWNAIA